MPETIDHRYRAPFQAIDILHGRTVLQADDDVPFAANRPGVDEVRQSVFGFGDIQNIDGPRFGFFKQLGKRPADDGKPNTDQIGNTAEGFSGDTAVLAVLEVIKRQVVFSHTGNGCAFLL